MWGAGEIKCTRRGERRIKFIELSKKGEIVVSEESGKRKVDLAGHFGIHVNMGTRAGGWIGGRIVEK